MLRKKPNQMNIHAKLYDRIPEDHVLKVMDRAIDFSFINQQLEVSYSKDYGRPAKDPEMMVKLLILQYLYNLSDTEIIEATKYNLAYMWFIGINPDDDSALPCSSLLSVFRNTRLLDTGLDDILIEVVKQGIKRGIIKGKGLSIDATHIGANTRKLVPERVMKHLAKKIFKSLQREMGEIPNEVNTETPDYKNIKDHNEAKATMKDYLESEIANVKESVDIEVLPKTKEAIEQAERILEDPKFIKQKGARSLVDEEARVGAKDRNSRFFGYKMENVMTDDGIIVAAHVRTGAYVDGTDFKDLLDKALLTGQDIKEVYGDRAYFRADILKLLKGKEIDPIIPVSASAYRINEELYGYNKDADQWHCVEGNETIKKKRYKHKNGREGYRYYFDKKYCITCPRRAECLMKSKNKAKVLNISLNANDLYAFSQRAQEPDFAERYKKRAPHEGKYGEMKNLHGLDRARGYGLKSVSIQAKLTALAVTLKKIAKLETACSLIICLFPKKHATLVLVA